MGAEVRCARCGYLLIGPEHTPGHYYALEDDGMLAFGEGWCRPNQHLPIRDPEEIALAKYQLVEVLGDGPNSIAIWR